MPPLPTSPMISSCGNFTESSAGVCGLKGNALPPLSKSVGNAAFSRHSGQSPFGALAASGLPQLGHRGVVCISIRHCLLLDSAANVTDQMVHTEGAGGHVGHVRFIAPLRS